MSRHKEFLKEIAGYLNKLSESDDIASVDHFPQQEEFLDEISPRFNLSDEQECSVGVSLTYIRMCAVLINEKEK